MSYDAVNAFVVKDISDSILAREIKPMPYESKKKNKERLKSFSK